MFLIIKPLHVLVSDGHHRKVTNISKEMVYMDSCMCFLVRFKMLIFMFLKYVFFFKVIEFLIE